MVIVGRITLTRFDKKTGEFELMKDNITLCEDQVALVHNGEQLFTFNKPGTKLYLFDKNTAYVEVVEPPEYIEKTITSYHTPFILDLERKVRYLTDDEYVLKEGEICISPMHGEKALEKPGTIVRMSVIRHCGKNHFYLHAKTPK